ncbi:MAG: GNAT family N-acetyltransferase [Ruminococcus sp.]|nr:GNAT family N-acetyltransferase [Ruminococcus sp.]
MLDITKLNEAEMRQFAEAFAYYDYGENEIGMVPFFPGYPDRTRLINYLTAMIRTANNAGAVYSTSRRNEGILIITDTTSPYPISASLKMMAGMVNALGLSGFKSVMEKFQAGGESLEKKYRKEKKQFVQIELLAVKKEYQGRGFMRPLIETAFEIADKKRLPVILSTDAGLKRDKYEHLGFTQTNVRQMDEKSFIYDIVREAGK